MSLLGTSAWLNIDRLFKKAILLYHIFFGLSKLFAVKNEKSFYFFGRKNKKSHQCVKTKNARKSINGWGRYATNAYLSENFNQIAFPFLQENKNAVKKLRSVLAIRQKMC